jgi:hypothetical protein
MSKSHNISNKSRGVTLPSLIDGYDPINEEEIISLPDRTTALIRGLDLVLEHHCASNVIRAELTAQVHAHLDTSSDETVWLKRSKYLLTYPLSKYLKNESPPEPDVKFQASGKLRRWMKQRICCFNRRNTHLWYSWLQAKRSTLPVSSDFVDSTYNKHLETLSRHDPGDDLTIQEIFSDPTFVHVLDRVKEEISKDILNFDDDFTSFSPSGNACFETTRGAGGQQFQLETICGLSGYDEHNKPVRAQYDPIKEFYGMRFDTVVHTRNGLRHNVVTEIRVDYGVDEWQSLKYHSYILDRRSRSCTIQAVLEPMKVRVISKGEALPYYSCKPLQKAMHSAMKHLCCFRLIGRPFSPTDLIDLKERSDPWDQWFSIDYSAATDGLSWKYSGRILRYIIDGLPQYLKDTALEVLGPHALHYPVAGKPSEKVFKGMQQNGQLMGSILSFPILCLANLGVYLKVTQLAQRHWSHHDRLNHVLINGDDMLYSANESLWKYHVDTAAKVGLEMSVGKAYHHREYANINSVSAHYSLINDRATPWQIDYLNTGLFFGQHKVQSRDYKTVVHDDIGYNGKQFFHTEFSDGRHLRAKAHMGQDPNNGYVTNINCLLQGCLPGKQTDILKKYLAMHKKDIYEECTGLIRSRGNCIRGYTRNLFAPLTSGGMGVIPPPGWKYKIKPVDRRVAFALKELSGDCKFDAYPQRGYPLREISSERSVPWVKVYALDKVLMTFNVPTLNLLNKYQYRVGVSPYGDSPHHVVLKD